MKRYTALVLVMVLYASLLVGCGCSGNVAVTTEPTTRATTAPTTAPTTQATTAPTTQPTTQPATRPSTAPNTDPTDTTGGIMDDITGTDGTMGSDRGTVPDDSTNGARGRRVR